MFAQNQLAITARRHVATPMTTHVKVVVSGSQILTPPSLHALILVPSLLVFVASSSFGNNDDGECRAVHSLEPLVSVFIAASFAARR